MNGTVYCDLEAFAESYNKIHGALSLFVCVLGSVANILNICVLTRKEMKSPTNLILTGLAVVDLLVMLDYIPFSYYIIDSRIPYIKHYSYGWAVMTKFHAIFSQVFHFTACCLTVTLAIWRYLAITNPDSAKFWCKYTKTLYIIIIIFLICLLICSPLFKSYTILDEIQPCDSTGKLLSDKNFSGQIFYESVYFTDYVNESNKRVCFWIYSVVLKLVPCILLTFLSYKLLRVLFETKRRRRLLVTSNVQFKKGKTTVNVVQGKERQANRTSVMLVTVLLLFLLTEFPQAILGFLSAIKEREFESQCYQNLGDVMDILALTNSAINFILYCTMSRKFRQTFKEVFRLKYLKQFNPLSQPSLNSEKTFTSSV